MKGVLGQSRAGETLSNGVVAVQCKGAQGAQISRSKKTGCARLDLYVSVSIRKCVPGCGPGLDLI